MMKKIFLPASTLLLLTGCAARLPEEELRLARERYAIECRIRHQPGYERIEKPFMADCELFEKKLKTEWEKPSDYAGGSMGPMDRNVRMTALEAQRIHELKTKWPAKP